MKYHIHVMYDNWVRLSFTGTKLNTDTYNIKLNKLIEECYNSIIGAEVDFDLLKTFFEMLDKDIQREFGAQNIVLEKIAFIGMHGDELELER